MRQAKQWGVKIAESFSKTTLAENLSSAFVGVLVAALLSGTWDKALGVIVGLVVMATVVAARLGILRWLKKRGGAVAALSLLFFVSLSCATGGRSTTLNPCVQTGESALHSPQPSTLHCLISSLATQLSTLETGYELTMRGVGEGRRLGWVSEEQYGELIEQGRLVQKGLVAGWGLLAAARRMEMVGEGEKGLGELWVGVSDVAKELAGLIEMAERAKKGKP